MSSAAPIGEVSAGNRKYSPVFLAVFAVFLIATTICVAGTLIGVLSAKPSHHDTLWFWASGHLLVHGGNPYNRQAMSQIETGLGLAPNKIVPMTLNPPSILFLIAPIGFLPPREGVLVWSLLLAACLIIAVLAIRGMVNRPGERNYLSLAWCFAPALCCIEVGQTGLIILLGLALFLRLHQSGPFLAGMALSLCAVKPHLLFPFGLVLFVWIVTRRRWMILLGAIAAVAVECLIALYFDHAVWGHYRAMLHTERFVDEFVPTLGVGLRYLIGRSVLWLQFIPAALGSLWGLWYFLRNRERWDWRTHGSLLTLVSLVAAPYSWFTDQVIALPAILFVLMSAKKPRRGSVTLLLAVMSAGAVEMMLTKSMYSKSFLWQGIAWLVWYLYATWKTAPDEDAVVVG